MTYCIELRSNEPTDACGMSGAPGSETPEAGVMNCRSHSKSLAAREWDHESRLLLPVLSRTASR